MSGNCNIFDGSRKVENDLTVMQWIHREVGLAYSDIDGRVELHSKCKDWQVQAFLSWFTDLAQESLVEWRRREHMKETNARLSRLVGGPFAGEQIEVSTWGKTFARQVRRGWWAVYKRKHGEMAARFVGYATSEFKARHYELAEAAPDADPELYPNARKSNEAAE